MFSKKQVAVLLSAALWSMLAAPAVAGPLQRAKERLQERRAERQAQQEGQGRAGAGTHEFTLRHQGLERKYLVHVPRSYTGQEAVPVLLAFHGGGGSATMMADDELYGIVGKAEALGFIAVFPNGYSRFPGGRLATHNAGHCCGDARDKQIDDVGFVRQVVQQVQRRYRTDTARVYATGMSNGGMMAHRLACEMADTFKAIAAVAGTDNTVACAPSRPVSVLHIHARNDTHVLFDGGAGDDAFRDESKVTQFTSVPATIDRWVGRNQCSPVVQKVLSVPGAYCERHASCSGGSAVQLCVTETGGHSWPGADRVARKGKEPASQAIDANEVMWQFFAGL
ncbi:MAG: PHB depolymerase family esterase [Pseudomonadota bacterium]